MAKLTQSLTSPLTSPLMRAVTAARSEGVGDGSVPYGDGEGYTANGYTALASPWSTYSGGVNEGLTSPADYQDTMRVNPASFPDDTLIQWRWPSPGPGSVAGYMHIARGNYDGSAAGGFAPCQVGNISSFTETFDLTPDATAADYTILNEFYLTTASGDQNAKAYEIAHWLHGGDALTFFATGQFIGDYTDASGRVWEVRNTGPDNAVPYIVFALKSGADLLTGTIDKLAALQWLISRGFLLNHLWVNGTAVGVEPFRGSGSMLVADYAVTFAGSGAAIAAPPANMLSNPNFTALDANWNGFWFSGKYVSGGKAVFNSGGGFGTVTAYDGIDQGSLTLTAGKYYQVSFVLERSAGSIRPVLQGGTNRDGTARATAGMFAERLLANTGNNDLLLLPLDPPLVGTIDNVMLTGPYNTSTVGGA